jgi:MFS family permease
VTVFLATAIGALGLAAGGTAGALLGDVLMSHVAAGLPLGLLVAGSAVAAMLISRGSSRVGRMRSLALGYVTGSVGAVVAVLAAATGSVALLRLGSTLLGAANAAIFLTRYAAAELAGPHARGRALGAVFAATALGAVASPNLLGPSGALMVALHLPRLAGLYVVAAVAFGGAGLLLARLAATATATAEGDRTSRPAAAQARGGLATRRDILAALGTRPVRVGLLVLAASNLIMVCAMTVAPVDMVNHDHSLTLIGVVISFHVASMFAPSPLTGRLADRAGAAIVGVVGVLLLAGSGLAGTLTTPGSTLATTTILVALGGGWNCGVVGGSLLLAGSVAPVLRVHLEGIGESVMGIGAAVGAPLGGVMLGVGSMPSVWTLTGGASVPVLLIICRSGLVVRAAVSESHRTRERS